MGFTVEPEKAALGKDWIRMRDGPGLLTGENMAKLGEKGFSIDLDGGWLGGDEQCVLSWTTQLFLPKGGSFAGYGWEIVIDDKPVVSGVVLLENPFDFAK